LRARVSGNVAPRALTELEILEIIGRFVTASAVAETAEFDGVKIHAAPGYLVVTQFLSQPASLIEATVPSAEECHVVVVTLYRCGE